MSNKPKRKSKSKGRRNPLMTFTAIALLVVIFAVMGLVAFLALAPPSPIELTATSVVQTNIPLHIIAVETATQAQLTLDMTRTAEASGD